MTDAEAVAKEIVYKNLSISGRIRAERMVKDFTTALTAYAAQQVADKTHLLQRERENDKSLIQKLIVEVREAERRVWEEAAQRLNALKRPIQHEDHLMTVTHDDIVVAGNVAREGASQEFLRRSRAQKQS